MTNNTIFNWLFKLLISIVLIQFQSITLIGQCSGTTINVNAPANNLASIVANAAPGTCFYLSNGNYTFSNVIPKDNMRFIGQSRGGVQVSGYGKENAFHGTADAVEIRNMTFHHFNDMGGAGGGPQEQSPIRGTPAIWVSNAGQLATNWVIDNIESHNNIAAGCFLGDHFTVTNSIFRNNGITGLGGDDFVGGLIKDNFIFNNGVNSAPGSLVNGGGIKFTQAGSAAHPVVIDGNEVYGNNKVGIWGDVACHGFEVRNNYVHDHFSHGILYEISDNAYIGYNNCVNNTTAWSNITTNWSAGGITSAESKDVMIEHNTVTGSRGGIVIQQTYRPADQFEMSFFAGIPDLTLVSQNVTIRYNTINGAVETGVGAAGTGNGQLSNASNLVFECNTYDNPNNMDFYWINGIKQNYSQWQSAGRDVCNNVPDADNDGTPDDQDPAPNDPCIPSNVVTACDTDGDGVPDGLDTCPAFDNNLIGTPCNDNDACTTNDLYTSNCLCEGTFLDSDEDGVCDANDNTPYYTVCPTPNALTIDGDLSDWNLTPSYTLNKVLAGAVGSPIDLAASFSIHWDNNNLYLAGSIDDDVLTNDGGNPWENDGVELYLDGGNEKSTSYDGNDHQLLFVHGDPMIYQHAGGPNNPAGVSFGMMPTATGYNIEIQLAWSFLGVTPTNTDLLGLDFHVNDDDDGGARDRKIAWSATLDEAWQNPFLFGTYELRTSCVPCPPAGTSCDDNDPNTINDQEDGNCNCIGTPVITGNIACNTNTPPTIDGDGTEWNETVYAITNVMSGTVASTTDLSADFQVSWDNNYLYVYGNVKDDVLMNDSQTQPYNDDVLEIYIDGGNEKATTYDANDHQLMFRVNDPDVIYWSASQVTNPAGVDFSRTNTADGYEIEVRIAWSFIGATPAHAKEIGLDIHINDDDDGGPRDKKMSWHATIDEAWNNPSLFNTVTLSNQCNLGRFVYCLPSLLLEGAYDTAAGAMNTDLLQAGLLPSGQPYLGAPWAYNGQEGAGWSTSDYPAGAVDWVLVSLRTSPLADDEIGRFAGVLLEDGMIVQLAPIAISQAITEAYVVVEHRNHLPAMSPTLINIVNDTLAYDFRLENSYTGQNSFGQKQIAGNWFLFAGNVDQTNPSGYEITGSDKIIWSTLNGNFGVYEGADFNLDSDISGLDRILWNQNNGISSGVPK